MADAFFRTDRGNGFLAATFRSGAVSGKPGSVKQIVHDGDTIKVSTPLNFSVRFLGIDTPEISYHGPTDTVFASPAKDPLAKMLSNPFDEGYAPIGGLSSALRQNISARASASAGQNHATLAQAAEVELERMISADMTAMGKTSDSFEFFLAFAYEALEHYGRLLCYVHPNQPDSAVRPLSYNERMLSTGAAAPYFIFPNVDPFRTKGSPLRAAFDAHSPQHILSEAPRLRAARTAVKASRAAGKGIFAPPNPLQFEAFELRFLADRRTPNRWLIDLRTDDRVLLHPQTYPAIPNAEDRLWVPEEFVSLFLLAGWVQGPSPGDLGN